MRLMFVYYAWKDMGSGLVLQGYTEAARALGHEVAVYGLPNASVPLNYSIDMASTDAVVFIFEWTTQLQYGDHLDFLRLVGKTPRARRVIVDGDGNYNDPVNVGGDYNHRSLHAARRWIEYCDSLSDKICQPTYHPLRSNVRPFLFYAFNSSWERALDFSAKEFSMVYVGHCKFRWQAMRRILRAIEPIRDRIGRMAMVGEGWGSLPAWATPMGLEDHYFSEPAYLRRMDVEILPPVHFERVIDWMSKATFNPVIARPIFDRLRFVTPRLFETLGANTIPLFGLDPAHVREIYGEAALELILPEFDPEQKIIDIMRRPEHFADIVRSIRRHLAEKHSHAARIQELIEIVES